MADRATSAAQALWDRVLERWADDSVHGAFIEHCASRGELPFAARCYREHGAAHEGPDGEAVRVEVDKRLAAIRSRALTELQAVRTDPQPKRGCQAALAVVAVAFFLSVLLLLSTLLR